MFVFSFFLSYSPMCVLYFPKIVGLAMPKATKPVVVYKQDGIEVTPSKTVLKNPTFVLTELLFHLSSRVPIPA